MGRGEYKFFCAHTQVLCKAVLAHTHGCTLCDGLNCIPLKCPMVESWPQNGTDLETESLQMSSVK